MLRRLSIYALFGCLIFAMGLLCVKATAQEIAPQVQVAEAFIELHTGPADGYPVFHVAGKGEWISILKRRTSWFKVQTIKGKQGWVKQQDLDLTLKPSGQAMNIIDGTFDSYSNRDFEVGAMGGILESVPSMSLVADWVLTENIATQISYTQALGDFSENQLVLASVLVYPFPQWRWSPFVSLGGGLIKTTPRANLVESGDEQRNSDLLSVGLGVRYYLARNVVIKAEYKSLLAITDRDEQEELEEWKLGFAVFF